MWLTLSSIAVTLACTCGSVTDPVGTWTTMESESPPADFIPLLFSSSVAFVDSVPGREKLFE